MLLICVSFLNSIINLHNKLNNKTKYVFKNNQPSFCTSFVASSTTVAVLSFGRNLKKAKWKIRDARARGRVIPVTTFRSLFMS